MSKTQRYRHQHRELDDLLFDFALCSHEQARKVLDLSMACVKRIV